MKLYSFFRSSAAYRVRIALNVKGMSYDYVAKHFRKNGGEHKQPEYLALNPQGLIPTLEDQGRNIPQSLAIIEYLEEAYPSSPRLLPAAPADRAIVRAMAQAIACDIHPLNNLRVLNYLKSPLGLSEDAVNTWYRHWCAEGFKALEQLIATYSGDGQHCFGNSVSLADVCLVPQVYNAKRFNTDLAPYPKLQKVAAYLDTLPAFDRAKPEVQPDAE